MACLLSVVLMSKNLLCLHYSHGLMPVCMKSCLFAKTRGANVACDHFCELPLAIAFILSSFSSLQKSLLDSFIPNILLFDPSLVIKLFLHWAARLQTRCFIHLTSGEFIGLLSPVISRLSSPFTATIARPS
jgi:hypothetical protein